VLEDYPGAVILAGVNRYTLAEAVSVMRSREKWYLETHALKVMDAIAAVRDAVGIDRILFGSEAPGSSLAAAVRYIRSSILSEAEQAAVLGGNAMKIWHAEEV
jgi:predicted TIM-barrel fold metal-dependent hydrolase